MTAEFYLTLGCVPAKESYTEYVREWSGAQDYKGKGARV